MASLMKVFGNIPARKCNGGVVYQVVRNHWNKDWKPDSYPTTIEQKEAAAKKYNLLPNEYHPIADDGLGSGDYPKLPNISGESRDPYYPWDFPEHKRNFNEPLHEDADAYGEDRFDVSVKTRYSLAFQFAMFMAAMGGSAAIFYFLQNKKMYRPVLPKQYPVEGAVHYSFEPAE